jgi:hypothetical protein
MYTWITPQRGAGACLGGPRKRVAVSTCLDMRQNHSPIPASRYGHMGASAVDTSFAGSAPPDRLETRPTRTRTRTWTATVYARAWGHRNRRQAAIIISSCRRALLVNEDLLGRPKAGLRHIFCALAWALERTLKCWLPHGLLSWPPHHWRTCINGALTSKIDGEGGYYNFTYVPRESL